MLPNRPLNELDLHNHAKHLPHFRGVFMLDNLPKKCHKYECGIVNLDISSVSGTHWVAYYKNAYDIKYFDSFGNLNPPIEIINYLGDNIKYNYNSYQNYDSIICGHLCLHFLYNCHQ